MCALIQYSGRLRVSVPLGQTRLGSAWLTLALLGSAWLCLTESGLVLLEHSITHFPHWKFRFPINVLGGESAGPEPRARKCSSGGVLSPLDGVVVLCSPTFCYAAQPAYPQPPSPSVWQKRVKTVSVTAARCVFMQCLWQPPGRLLLLLWLEFHLIVPLNHHR